LQRAKPLTLEARIAGYQLRFRSTAPRQRRATPSCASPRRPLPSWVRPICAPGDSTKRPCSAPKTPSTRYTASPWRSHRGRLAGLSAKGDPLADTFASRISLPGHEQAPSSGTWMPINNHDWAVQFRLGKEIRNNCGTGSSSATRTPSSRPIRVTKDNRGARLPCLFPRRSIRGRQLPGFRTQHRHPAS
jgi:hypothetical protein